MKTVVAFRWIDRSCKEPHFRVRCLGPTLFFIFLLFGYKEDNMMNLDDFSWIDPLNFSDN